MLALLHAESYVRLDLGPGELESHITVGLHGGWGDGQLVLMSDNGKTEFGLDLCDGVIARDLASVFAAYADWCEERFTTLTETEE
jgi:hypothetical protein